MMALVFLAGTILVPVIRAVTSDANARRRAVESQGYVTLDGSSGWTTLRSQARWDVCAVSTIDVLVDVGDGAPGDAVQRVERALAVANGGIVDLRLRLAGTVRLADEAPLGNPGPGGEVDRYRRFVRESDGAPPWPVVLRWPDPYVHPRRTAGYAFPVVEGGDIVGGLVALNRTGDVGESTMLHELGHILGLGHAWDGSALMRPSGAGLDWGPSDLDGLEWATSAAGRGC